MSSIIRNKGIIAILLTVVLASTGFIIYLNNPENFRDLQIVNISQPTDNNNDQMIDTLTLQVRNNGKDTTITSIQIDNSEWQIYGNDTIDVTEGSLTTFLVHVQNENDQLELDISHFFVIDTNSRSFAKNEFTITTYIEGGPLVISILNSFNRYEPTPNFEIYINSSKQLNFLSNKSVIGPFISDEQGLIMVYLLPAYYVIWTEVKTSPIFHLFEETIVIYAID